MPRSCFCRCPNTPFWCLKPHFLMVILPFLAMFFMVRKGFVYAVAVNFYAFCLAFSTILHCILHHFTLYLAPKRTAFCGISPCVLHQNAVHLAANCTWFCWKQPKSRYKLRFYAMCVHFTCIYNHPTFAPKQTSARIEFLRQGWRLVDKKATFSVKFLTEKFTAASGLASGQVNE